MPTRRQVTVVVFPQLREGGRGMETGRIREGEGASGRGRGRGEGERDKEIEWGAG